MLKKTRLLLSGPGLIGRQHAKYIDENPDAILAAVVAPESEENFLFAKSYNAKQYTDIEEALKNEKVDGAIISSPNEFHYAQALECIENRVPVLIEKPITDNTEQSLKLYKKAIEYKTPVLVGHHRTYNPLLETAKEFIDSENFGQFVTFSGNALFYKPAHYFQEGPWRTKKGGGPILINLIHEIGLIRYLCGEIKSVFAVASHNIRHYEVEDTVVITLIFNNGGLGSFVLSDTASSNQSWELTTGENPAYPTHDNSNCYHFAGTKGSLDFPTMNARYYSNDAKRSWWEEFTSIKIDRPNGHSLKRQLQHFIDVIHHEAEPMVTALDGHMNLVVVDAIMKSIQNQTMINIDVLEQ